MANEENIVHTISTLPDTYASHIFNTTVIGKKIVIIWSAIYTVSIFIEKVNY